MMVGWTMSAEAWIWMGVWALVMILVVWILVREPHHAAPTDPADILRHRFARGELSEDEFQRAMRALGDTELPRLGATPARPTHGQEAGRD